MPRPQFSLKTMLWLVTLTAVGLGLASADSGNPRLNCLFCLVGWACWGAVIGRFFGRTKTGAAVIGALLLVPLVVLTFTLED